jgi:hypothetical protein
VGHQAAFFVGRGVRVKKTLIYLQVFQQVKPRQMMNLFLVFAGQDQVVCDRLVQHLNLLKERHLSTIYPSGKTDAPVLSDPDAVLNLLQADVVLLLVSVDFFNDPTINENLLTKVFDRHLKGDCLLIPILAKSCLWQETYVGKFLQSGGLTQFPNDEKPLVYVDNVEPDDERYVETIKGVRQIMVEYLEKQRAAHPAILQEQHNDNPKKIKQSGLILIPIVALILFYILLSVSQVTTKQLLSDHSFSFDYPLKYISGGSFIMGSPENEKGRYGDECQHHAILPSYYLGKYEVTQAQWMAIMGSNPSEHSNCNDCPVEAVTWNEIQQFITKLNILTGMKYRLPSEEEWEYAARAAGNSGGLGFLYSGSSDPKKVAWYYENTDRKSHPVGQKAPNNLGLYDMSGNVWEFCQNEYEAYPGCNGYGIDARVLRGGSWFNNAQSCRVAARSGLTPGRRTLIAGFRLAL